MTKVDIVFSDGYRPVGWIKNGSQMVFLSYPDLGSKERSLRPYIVSIDDSNISMTDFNQWTDSGESLGKYTQFSPDGTLIATAGLNLQSEAAVVVRDHAAGQAREVISGRSLAIPAWSFDGQQIAAILYSNADDEFSLWIADKDGQNQKAVIANQHSIIEYVAWSPDGNQLVFSTLDAISAVNINDGRITRIVEAREDQTVSYPTWSPDGNHIAYTEGGLASSFGDIVVVNAAGTNKRYLTKISNWDQPTDDDHKCGYLMWSPRGEYIAASRLLLWHDPTEESRLEVVLVQVPDDLQ